MKIFLDANILFSASQVGSPIRKLLESIHPNSVLISHPGVVEEPLPAKDQPVLAAAVGCRADILLTGDRRQFGPLYGSTLAGVKICSVRQLAEEMITPGWLEK